MQKGTSVFFPKDKVLSTLFVLSIILFVIMLIFSYSPKEEKELISTTSYNEFSTITPVYTSYKEGSKNFNKVITDLEYYTTKPTQSVQNLKKLTGIRTGDAESLFYVKNVYEKSFLDIFSDWLGVSPETEGTLILYNKESKTYTTHSVNHIDLSYTSNLNDIKSYYSKEYGGYYGAPNPSYSYTQSVEIVKYSDGTYEWNHKEDWKIDNEDELKAYISSSPTKKN